MKQSIYRILRPISILALLANAACSNSPPKVEEPTPAENSQSAQVKENSEKCGSAAAQNSEHPKKPESPNAIFQKRDTVYSEDFEGTTLEDIDASLSIVRSCTELTESPNTVISGKKSLLLDTEKNTKKFPFVVSMRCPTNRPFKAGGKKGERDFKCGFTYEVQLKYRVIKSSPNTRWIFALHGNKKSKFVRYFEFEIDPKIGEVKTLEMSARVENGEAMRLTVMNIGEYGAIAVDDIKITSKPNGAVQPWFKSAKSFPRMKATPLNYFFCDENPSLFKMSQDEFFPFIDEFGQFKHKDWSTKIHSKAELISQKKKDDDYIKNTPDIPKRDEFGGLMDESVKLKATGRFRTEKYCGKWYFVTPKGNLFWSIGVSTVGLFAGTDIAGREHFFESAKDAKFLGGRSNAIGKSARMYSFEERNISIKYGDNYLDKFVESAQKRLKKWGFNSLGCWTRSQVLKQVNLPFAETLGSSRKDLLKSTKYLKIHSTNWWSAMTDYFHPDFESDTRKLFSQAKPQLDNAMCYGVFVDNEIPWQTDIGLMGKNFLSCPADQYAKLAFQEFLKKKYSKIENLNSAWKASYSNWEAFLSETNFIPDTSESKKDMLEIEKQYYARYFSVCKKLIRELSPDSLYLGCRFSGFNEVLVNVASEYVDVMSFNLYRDTIRNFALPKDAKDVPIIVGEFHFGSQDAGTFGGGIRFRRTTQERAKAYENYADGALENPSIVGIHWFRWSDQVTSGRPFDGENYCCGIVDICDTPIPEMTQSTRAISEDMYDKRLSTKK